MTTKTTTTKAAALVQPVAKSARARAAAKANGKPTGVSAVVADPNKFPARKRAPRKDARTFNGTVPAPTVDEVLAADKAAVVAKLADPVANVVDAANKMTDAEWESTDTDPNPDLTAKYLTILEEAVAQIPTVTIPVLTVEPEAFAAMDRVERLRVMKLEQQAVVAWKANGSEGDAPVRPVSNAAAMELLDNGGTVGAVEAKAPGKGHSRWAPDAEAELVARIRRLRDEGKGWPTIAKTFNEDGTATAKGGKWASSTVMGIGKRHGIPTTRPAA